MTSTFILVSYDSYVNKARVNVYNHWFCELENIVYSECLQIVIAWRMRINKSLVNVYISTARSSKQKSKDGEISL